MDYQRLNQFVQYCLNITNEKQRFVIKTRHSGNVESKRAVSAIENFVERVGLASEEDGLPRIAGRLMAFLVIHGGPVSFSDLAASLQVSRGSVSTNSRILISLGVIERVSLPGERQDFFQLAEQPYSKMMAGYIERTRRMQSVVVKTQQELDASARPGAAQRLQEMQRFYEVSMHHLSAMLAELGRGDARSAQ